MCRKWKLIANIENTSIEEIVAYIQRLFRIYLLFLVLSAVYLIEYIAEKETVSAIFAAVSLVLYVIHIIALNVTRKDPTVQTTMAAIGTAGILSIFNIIDLIYNALNGSIWALFSLIGVVLQWGTIYILYKLREKIQVRNAGGGGNTIPINAVPAEPTYNPTYGVNGEPINPSYNNTPAATTNSRNDNTMNYNMKNPSAPVPVAYGEPVMSKGFNNV
jgi:hypothetical protein